MLANVWRVLTLRNRRGAMTSPWLHDQLASLPGYSVTQCGERLATVPPP